MSALPTHRIDASFSYRSSLTNIPIVELEIAGQGTFSFIVDTGANTSALYLNSPAAQAITPLEGEELLVRGLTTSAPRPAALLSGLRIGNRTYNDVRIALLENDSFLNEIDGVLGTDILCNYVLIFDPALDRLDFVQGAEFDRAAYEAWNKVPLTRLSREGKAQRLWVAQVQITDSQLVPVLIDTGADFSVMNWPAAQLKADLGDVYSSLRDDWEVAGAVGEFRPRISLTVDRFIMGEHEWRTPKFLVFDFNSLTDILGEGEPMVIAGSNLFADRRFAFDFGNNELLVDPVGPHAKQEIGSPEEEHSVN